LLTPPREPPLSSNDVVDSIDTRVGLDVSTCQFARQVGECLIHVYPPNLGQKRSGSLSSLVSMPAKISVRTTVTLHNSSPRDLASARYAVASSTPIKWSIRTEVSRRTLIGSVHEVALGDLWQLLYVLLTSLSSALPSLVAKMRSAQGQQFSRPDLNPRVNGWQSDPLFTLGKCSIPQLTKLTTRPPLSPDKGEVDGSIHR
jgi:hypothetical protein